ncbi:MAG: hypothetical protein JST79_01730 [Acidobacteria bacterium]|nr:hypothetical protein [Acidobacteriota bacterium]
MKPPLWATALAVALCLLSGPGQVAVASAATDNLPQSSAPAPSSANTTGIPGPMRSFLRMAGISQKAPSEEVLPLLARNVFSQGYQGSGTRREPTEFLLLLARYVQQARELQALAGSQGMLRVTSCDDAKPLLDVLGYRVRQDCGHAGTFLETANAQRAFLTTDSGFPLPELERTLQGGRAFEYAYPTTQVRVMFGEKEWLDIGKKDTGKDSHDLVDVILRDPALARLYWGLSRMDEDTAALLQQSPGLPKLLEAGSMLDFYGRYINVHNGSVVVPGGTAAAPRWKEMVGESPDNPGAFILALLSKDKGWMAAYFDALSRVSQNQQAHLTQAQRLQRYYEAFHGDNRGMHAARPVFRPAPGLLLLVTRLQWEADGTPRIPGNLEMWKKILRQRFDSRLIAEWGKRASRFNSPEQLIEAMFAISRLDSENGPLQIFLLLNELDSRKFPAERLTPETQTLMAANFLSYSNQYLIFAEFPELNDTSIRSFIQTARSLDNISNHTLRGNGLGTFQANLGLWQILARQGQVPRDKFNESWQAMLKPFAKVSSSSQLFDAGRESLRQVLLASLGRPNASQDEIIDLLAGPHQSNPEDQRIHAELADRMRAVMAGQRLISLDAVLALGDGMHEVQQVKSNTDVLLGLAEELRSFEMPQPIFSKSERTQWAAGIYNNRHTDLQMRTDLTKIVRAPESAEQLAEARGQLTSFLRDTLVGLNYAYYEPPGAQILHHNPLFIRSHDFAAETVMGMEHVWQAPQLFGTGFPAGGGAHLVGSLADLPYVLCQAEQNFIAPENVQALIWEQVVPGLLTSAIVPRWWGVSRQEMHAVTLHQREGEELLTASVQDKALRQKVLLILAERMSPQRLERLQRAWAENSLPVLMPRILPADTFYLSVEFRRKFSGEKATWGAAGTELSDLVRDHPDDVRWERLSRDFGVPHPVLAQTYTRELLNLEPFPTFTGYSSRLLAESWDSNNLYWARLADEQGYSPAMLNRLAPQLTHRMVEKIFASEFEDWPALLRAARETGEEFRQGKLAPLSADAVGPVSGQP